ncbi:MAG: nicotinate phosphoribosyltransferase, partial [Muribaculaceae bacterium]|nr:nicotinate phosphoribosyltransferase [Muribaculaceae bacterium]
MKQIINHFTDDDLYKLSMCCAVIDNYPRAQVKYTFCDRDNLVYPKGFGDELRHQIELLENVVITDEEIAFMRRKCYFIPDWFYTYLKGYRYKREWVTINQDEEGHLQVDFEG